MLHVVAGVVARLPCALVAPLGRLLGFVAGSLLRVRRSLVEAAMVRAGVAGPSRAAGSVYRDLGRGLAELLWTAGASALARADAVARVGVDDDAIRALDRALAEGPVVLFASHTGNWELAAAAAARLLRSRGRRLLVVAKRIHDPAVDRFVASVRASLGVVVVPPEGALATVRRALTAGDVVAMPIDQVPERASHASALPFLGQAAFVDRAPATIAWRSRATVLVVAAERSDAVARGSGSAGVGHGHRVRLLATIGRGRCGEARLKGERGEARQWIDEALATATSALDAFVRRSPTAWFWLHRRWRAPAGGAERGAVERGVVERATMPGFTARASTL